MVISYPNLMLKGPVDKQAQSPECRGICVDQNSNPMSESEHSASRILQFDNKILTSNGRTSREIVCPPYQGLGGDRNSASVTDGIEDATLKRNSTNSRDINREYDNSKICSNNNRESCCSVESQGSNIQDQRMVSNDTTTAKSPGKSKQFMKLTRGLKFSKGTPQNAQGQPQNSPPNSNDSKSPTSPKDGISPNNGKTKKNLASGQQGKKQQDNKVRLFNRKRRNRNKLISNAGNSLWRPLVCYSFSVILFAVLDLRWLKLLSFFQVLDIR